MEKQQQIVFTVTNNLENDRRMYRICASLAEAGYGVTLVGRNFKNVQNQLNFPFQCVRLNCWFKTGFAFYAEFNLRLFLWLLLNPSINIISSVDADTIFACFLAAKIRSLKLVFDAHEYFTEVPELTNKRFTKLIWQGILKTCVPHANLCYTVSPSLAQLFSVQYKQPFHTIYNMPLIQNPINSFHKSTHCILYLGDLNQGRGIELLIEAMQQIDCNCLIAGDGPLKTQLQKLVTSLNLNEKITFTGKISPANFDSLWKQATIGVNLLNPVSLSYQYSLANKFFDYVQAGIPSVTSNFIEYRTLNQTHEVSLLCNYNINELVTQINLLIHNPKLYAKLEQNCNEAAQAWHWETQKQKLIQLYQSVHA